MRSDALEHVYYSHEATLESSEAESGEAKKKVAVQRWQAEGVEDIGGGRIEQLIKTIANVEDAKGKRGVSDYGGGLGEAEKPA